MADYFTNFSVVLPLTKPQQEYALDLVARIQAYRSDNQPLPNTFPSDLMEVVEDWAFEVEGGEQGLWLNSQSGGQEAACSFIQHLLQKFEFASEVSFEWSHDCSKPIPDAFGGGAAFITSESIETFTTSDWLQKMLNES
jgi:hypothetical protein